MNFKQRLKSKQGASLLMVIAFMTVLISMGSTVLVSASTSAKKNKEHITSRTLYYYANSYTKLLKDQLLVNDHTQVDNIGSKIVMASYWAADDPAIKEIDDFHLVLNRQLSKYGAQVEPIEIRFTDHNIQITPETPEVPPVIDPNTGSQITPGSPRVAKSAHVNLDINVVVTVNKAEQSYRIISKYSYKGGYLEDDIIINPGVWKFEGYIY